MGLVFDNEFYERCACKQKGKLLDSGIYVSKQTTYKNMAVRPLHNRHMRHEWLNVIMWFPSVHSFTKLHVCVYVCLALYLCSHSWFCLHLLICIVILLFISVCWHPSLSILFQTELNWPPLWPCVFRGSVGRSWGRTFLCSSSEEVAQQLWII